ncbi:YgdI/YgdR family lipoprotein [Stutzerimonas kirkiae]|uniref:YgdI/YgdR family lipoprotein n=1 Tax=Stutzerimonas kirkiae TaxID=2211392 RepID=A0A4Q9RFP5_9GAMM|nr:YgdI/YgdR family lipoprotein [Stutzerimonas kirkiae]TBV00042.1 YgdI/YgdR family lipoprotein [Stutzerimonas kirkiae]TBV05748.1 YgdI/YgdR family lipoprotein [Stutzerimonas kirkiae]TBV09543.1 YgdI/YgdR family lipoprotein [Stutzerimonas kirkiae]TBV17375.1 YgdI/YgdR family lipoprotein [Stutzerimonas kirkiae]
MRLLLKLPALLLIMGSLALAGCSTPSVITLDDGREIQTLDRPDYDEDSGFYEYQLIDGSSGKVNKDRVRTVRDL